MRARLVLLSPGALGVAAGERCGHRSSSRAGHQLCISICASAGMPPASSVPQKQSRVQMGETQVHFGQWLRSRTLLGSHSAHAEELSLTGG